MENSVILSSSQIESRTLIQRVFGWMSFGVLITAIVAQVLSTNETFIRYMLENRWLFWGLIIGELLMVISLSAGIQRMSSEMAKFVFLTYAALNGATFSIFFFIYTGASLASTFFVVAAMFGATAMYGYVTKRDLSAMGSFLFMGLIGLVIASIVNIFWANETLYWVTTYVGVIVFVGLTIYDVNRIKLLAQQGFEDEETYRKLAIIGALTLYLDFVNMFIYMLRILGKKK